MNQIERPWSPEEDEMLVTLFEKHGFNWSLISKSIPGRSATSCWSRWLSSLQSSFTPEEDEMLLNLIEKHGSDWSLFSKSIPGKSVMKCWSRWLSLQRPFTPEEDEMLLNLIENHGHNWSLISKSIPGRSANLCQSRWLSLQRSFTLEEDEMLVNLVEEDGPNWLLISNSIPRTSALSCKARWVYLNRPFTPKEDKMLLTLVKKHGPNYWSKIGESIPGRATKICKLRSETIWKQLNIREDLENHWNSTLKLKTRTLYKGNSSHEVGYGVSGQPPSISDMARGNTSSGGTHSYSRDQSAPSWNALNKRDSSIMMIDSDSVQEFVGDEFGWNDSSEVSSKKCKKTVVTNDN